MKSFIRALLLILVCNICLLLAYQKLQAQDSMLGREQKGENVSCSYKAALQSNKKTKFDTLHIMNERLNLACVYIEQGKYSNTINICDEILSESRDFELMKIARNLRAKALARKYYIDGIEDISKSTKDQLITYHFIDYEIDKHIDHDKPDEITNQLMHYIDLNGYSSHAAILTLKLFTKSSTKPQDIYGNILRNNPTLKQDTNFVFDYAKAAGPQNSGLAIRCLHIVINNATDPRQKADALFMRHLAYAYINQRKLARRDLQDCRIIINRHNFEDMKDKVSECFSALDRFDNQVKYDASNDRIAHIQTKRLYGPFSYICALIIIPVVCYRVFMVLKVKQ